MSDKQVQRAGDNAIQYQGQTVNVHYGITEERAREIIDEKLKAFIDTYSLEAHATAYERNQEFSSVLIPKLVREQLLESLKDPGIQLQLMEAEKSAISSGKQDDYELLSELLIHRVKKGDDRNVKAGVSQAIKIVDEISEVALQGLTVAHAIRCFIPVSGRIEEGLNALSVLFSKIIYEDLPSGMGWIDHLDVLNAVRINSIGSLRKIDQVYANSISGYFDIGIKAGSDNYLKALDILKSAQIPSSILTAHELREGYFRLLLPNRDRIDDLRLQRNIKIDKDGRIVEIPVEEAITEEHKVALNQIYDLYEKNEELRNENILRFMDMFNSQLDPLRRFGMSIEESSVTKGSDNEIEK